MGRFRHLFMFSASRWEDRLEWMEVPEVGEVGVLALPVCRR